MVILVLDLMHCNTWFYVRGVSRYVGENGGQNEGQSDSCSSLNTEVVWRKYRHVYIDKGYFQLPERKQKFGTIIVLQFFAMSGKGWKPFSRSSTKEQSDKHSAKKNPSTQQNSTTSKSKGGSSHGQKKSTSSSSSSYDDHPFPSTAAGSIKVCCLSVVCVHYGYV